MVRVVDRQGSLLLRNRAALVYSQTEIVWTPSRHSLPERAASNPSEWVSRIQQQIYTIKLEGFRMQSVPIHNSSNRGELSQVSILVLPLIILLRQGETMGNSLKTARSKLLVSRSMFQKLDINRPWTKRLKRMTLMTWIRVSKTTILTSMRQLEIVKQKNLWSVEFHKEVVSRVREVVKMPL